MSTLFSDLTAKGLMDYPSAGEAFEFESPLLDPERMDDSSNLTAVDTESDPSFADYIFQSNETALTDDVLNEEEMMGEDESDYPEESENFDQYLVQEDEDTQENEADEYDEYEGVTDFEETEEPAISNLEDEVPVDLEEWEEDSLETVRTEQEEAGSLAFSEPDMEDFIPPGGIGSFGATIVNHIQKANQWLQLHSKTKVRFAHEPEYNIDQLPIPDWVNPQTFYSDFIKKHGDNARTIIGNATQKVLARYFVLHDTAVAAEFTPSRIKGKGIHLWLNAKTPVLLGNDWHIKGLGVKLERSKNNSFVHVEITRDAALFKKVQQKTKGKRPSGEEITKEGGVRNFGTYYNDLQYELLAYAYLVASLRKGSFLTVTMHREVDRSVVVNRGAGKYGYGHDDPQFFDLNYFYEIICRLLNLPLKASFGIQNDRALAQKQGNMAGYVNEFIPFVTGDAAAANQYGELKRLTAATVKYKLVKLKHGTYYDVTKLKNQLQQKELNDQSAVDISNESAKSTSVSSNVNVAAVPQFICEDSLTLGYTCYVKIDLGKANYPLNMSGIYVPATFNPRQPVDVILYLHGMTSEFPGECSRINEYWSITELPKFDLRLREEVNAGGKNVILVAPSLGKSPNAQKNKLSGGNGGLDSYMEKVLLAANEYIIKRRFNATPIIIRNIILAAHSAGGRQMRMIAMFNNPVNGPKITECWGFDSLYETPDLWIKWASANKFKKLMIYYQGSTKDHAMALDARTKKLLNVFVKKSAARNHYWVPKEHFKERIGKIGQADLTKVSFEDENPDYWNEPEELVTDLSKTIRLNQYYGDKLGWKQFHDQINDLLLKYSGQQNVSLDENAFAYAAAAWQQQHGFSGNDADGVIGPKTWQAMKPFLSAPPATTLLATPPPATTLPVEHAEWRVNAGINAYYNDWLAYKGKRDEVASWGIPNPASYIETAINEWKMNRGIHVHFGHNFDGDPHHSYLNLKRLYLNHKERIADPAGYFSANIVTAKFFNKTTPAHRDLQKALQAAQSSLTASGQSYHLDSAWSFVPRTQNDNSDKLSNHALGKAIDINPSTNPHITSPSEIRVINAVCGSVLPSGLLAEKNPDILRSASDHFKLTFNEDWINRQTDASLKKAINSRRVSLNKYANKGFLDLPGPLIKALQSAGLTWGGNWKSAKDFMHFELI